MSMKSYNITLVYVLAMLLHADVKINILLPRNENENVIVYEINRISIRAYVWTTASKNKN